MWEGSTASAWQSRTANQRGGKASVRQAYAAPGGHQSGGGHEAAGRRGASQQQPAALRPLAALAKVAPAGRRPSCSAAKPAMARQPTQQAPSRTAIWDATVREAASGGVSAVLQTHQAKRVASSVRRNAGCLSKRDTRGGRRDGGRPTMDSITGPHPSGWRSFGGGMPAPGRHTAEPFPAGGSQRRATVEPRLFGHMPRLRGVGKSGGVRRLRVLGKRRRGATRWPRCPTRVPLTAGGRATGPSALGV